MDRLLPDWFRPVSSVLVFLQPCACNLSQRTAESEYYKHVLRQQFLQVGSRIAQELQWHGHLAELFDPKTGFPIHSRSGSLRLDDVAVVRDCLDYTTIDRQGCCVILHPTWGSSIYPSILLSSAEPQVVEPICHQLMATGNPFNVGVL